MKSFLVTVLALFIVTTVYADYFVLNSISQTLSRIDTGNWTIDNSFEEIGAYPSAAPNRIAVHDDTAWITVTYENSIQSVSLDNRWRSTIYLADSASPWDVICDGDNAYVSGSGVDKVYRIDLVEEEVTGEVSVGVYPQGLAIHDGQLYVCNTGFHFDTYTYDPGTISVIDLESFAVIETLDCGLNPQAAAVIGNELHVVCTGDYATAMGEVDIFSLASHEPLDVVETGGSPGRIAASDDNVYLGNSWPAGVYVYSIDSHDILYTPADSPFSGGSDVVVSNGKLLTVDAGDYINNSAIRVYDLEDNSLLHQFSAGVGAVDLKGWNEDVSIDDDEEQAGNAVVNPLALWPNPAREGCQISYSLAESRPTEARIYNARGQRVRSLRLEDGSGWWDGRDAQGRTCPTGVYMIRVSNGEQTTTRRMTILR